MMPPDKAIANTAMEGGGFYNRNSDLQAAGIELALPLLIEAARAIPVTGGAPLVIADYGSSQGRNSMRPMRLAIETLRARAGADRAIEVVHTDLPSNDFASLFTTLQEDGASYLAGQKRVFPSAIGRSYFEPILPAGRVHLGWNTWTLHWMSRNPIEVSDHLIAAMSASQDARAMVSRQQALDWTNFLSARSAEMAQDARLVSIFIGRTPEAHGWDWVFGALWQAALAMEREGLLTAQELTRFTTPAAGRSVADMEAPFADGPFHGLVLEHAEVCEGPDPFWDEFQETSDAALLGKRWAGMMRAVTSPIAAAAFAARPNCGALVDELYRRMEARIAAAPQHNIHFLAIAVIRKT
ncbi:MAG TPA: hypothetical protein VFI23_07980 [Rhizomicrobium sp.]|nr:hypothetical protein [Rhizomicrobium sp.]